MLISIEVKEGFNKIQHPFTVIPVRKQELERTFLNMIKILVCVCVCVLDIYSNLKTTASIIMNGKTLNKLSKRGQGKKVYSHYCKQTNK